MTTPLLRARLCLEALSVGDAFGERFFGTDPAQRNSRAVGRVWPDERSEGRHWQFTDDTIMATAIVEELAANGRILEGSLARRFANAYEKEPDRGYGSTAHTILGDLVAGVAWQEAAARPYDGTGSKGNGGAMRSAPIGVFFDNVDVVVEEAVKSALPTHRHPEGVSGAIAIAVGAFALADNLADDAVWDCVIGRLSDGAVRDNVRAARAFNPKGAPEEAALALGSGGDVLAEDTVGCCLWSALRARALGLSFEHSLFDTVRCAGDIDTNCAIVGGLLGVPLGWAAVRGSIHARREPLPPGLALAEAMADRTMP